MITLRIPQKLYQKILADLGRPHSFAYERIGFARIKLGNKGAANQLLLMVDYWAVPDEQYLHDEFAGARINSDAIRAAMQVALSTGDGVMHVHMHDFPGTPAFSLLDRDEIPRLVQSLVYANSKSPQGMLLLGHDSAAAEVMMPAGKLVTVDKISVVGQPTFVISELPQAPLNERYSRQGFLGPYSPERLRSLKVGIIGYSGAGSHVGQQLAHVGFIDYAVFDAQSIDESNLNRFVGATDDDVKNQRLKVDIAKRVITSISPDATVQVFPARWQDHPEVLRSCDLVLAGLDGFDERRQLEAACRRYLIPMIDVGMDIVQIEGQSPRLAGQVILSLPGYPCLYCIGFLNEKTLAAEAQRYGEAAGPNPQVVWPNGILVSTAVSIAVELATGWRKSPPSLIYKLYDGNLDLLIDHPRYKHVHHLQCQHYKLDEIGDPKL